MKGMSNMKEPEKEIIRNHLYFVKEEKNVFYLQKSDVMYEIIFRGEWNEEFPISYDHKTKRELSIWELENWFKEVYYQVNQLYFKRDRIRRILNGKRRYIFNIIHISSLMEEKGADCLYVIANAKEGKTNLVEKEYLPWLNRLKVHLEKEGYQVSLLEENEEEISFTIY